MDLEFLTLACGALFIAGSVKGIVGFGVPTVSIAILTIFADITSVWPVVAMACLITNIWQAINGPHLLELLKRFRFLLIASAVTTVITYFLVGIRFPSLTLFVLGSILFSYALSRLLNLRLLPKITNEKRSSVIIGFVQGLVTGVSGTFIVPMLLYFQNLQFDRNRLIQILGISFTINSAAFGTALALNGQFSVAVTAMSAFAVLPALVGMHIGRRLRFKLSEKLFEQVFLVCLMLAGANLILRSINSH